MNTMSTGAASRPALTRGAVRGAAAILTLFLVAILSQFAPQASAEQNKSVNVTNLSLTRVDGNNIEQEGKLNTYDLARLSFDWSGVDANLKSGDSFTIGLGEYFTNLQNSETHPMTVEYGGKDVEVGTCTLTVKDVTCTFNSKVDELKAAGFHNFKGSGSALVAEADESDRSFLNYTPRVEIVTNVEPDHLDSYGTAEAFETAFVDFAHRLVPGGLLVACAADAGALRLAQSAAAEGLRVVTYSFAGPDTLPGGVLVGEGHVHLDIQERGASSTRGLLTFTTAAGREPAGGAGEEPHHGPVELVLAVPGDHVALDAAGAWAAGIELGVEPALMARALGAFGGTGRRFEDRGEADGVRVIDDYAHHPTEIEALLRTARGVAQERGGRVLVLFQPHLFSRTRAFADRFGQALALADAVVVTDVYPARETQADFPDITGDTVAQRVPGGTARFVAERLDAAHAVADLARPGDLLLTVGAGDVTELAGTVLGDLAAREGGAAPSPADRDERA